MPTLVAQTPAAASSDAERHFAARLTFETDCWDTHDSLQQAERDFVLVDVRSPAMYAQAHIPGAINIPHGKLVASTLAAYPQHTLFVVYCAGPHCNGANRGALRLARLGYPVKELIGGMTGWADEGFAFEGAALAVAA